MFEAVRRIVMAVREADPQAHFLVECVDFSQRHPADFDAVSEALGVQPWVLDAASISACTRKRAYWASFEAEAPTAIEVDPNSVLEPGRTTWWRKLPTIVASVNEVLCAIFIPICLNADFFGSVLHFW